MKNNLTRKKTNEPETKQYKNHLNVVEGSADKHCGI
jgi:hypothetical protein